MFPDIQRVIQRLDFVQLQNCVGYHRFFGSAFQGRAK
ncbi:hypothetical protein SAMN05444161_6227 [Rhizobiales bacterium GAS191]|nr:hypothetical protein SAMN05444161_6227 [Rhizobiales bacterium GAS191]